MRGLILLLGLIGTVQASTLEEFQLANKPWIDPFTEAFINELRPSRKPMSLQVASAIDDLKRSQLTLQGQSYRMNIQNRCRGDAQVFVVTFHSEQNPYPLGVWIFSVRDEQVKEVTYEFLKFSSAILIKHTGVAEAAFKLFGVFSKKIEARSDYLEAGWVGRYFWAKKGFAFRSDTVVYENDIAINQLQLAKNNFRRFCQAHGIEVGDLRRSIGRSDSRISEDLHELQTPLDFLKIIHKDRIKIQTLPYIDHNELGPAKTLDVGKAFAVADYRPSPLQKNSVEVGGLFRSDTAMPPWYGFRPLSCEEAVSPKQLQI